MFAQSFAALVSYAVGTHPYDAEFGDFNGDGKPDLAVANNSTLGTRRITTSFNPLMELSHGNAPSLIYAISPDGQADRWYLIAAKP